ncbi:MAG: glycosyltransferase family 4 protein, partial [Sedimentisphaerales bacterium]|nr:glycosyltransferase family 4 protein [Sedimentisphaerales bacterium]
LQERGVRPFVVTKYRDRTIPRQETMQGIDVFRLSWADTPIQRNLYSLRVLNFLLAGRNTYDIIHAHGIFPYTYSGIISARLHSKKILAKMITYGADDPQSIARRTFGGLQLNLVSRLDRIISISSELSVSFRQSGLPGEKLIEIPNGVDTTIFRPLAREEKNNLRQQLNLPQHQTIFSFMGVVNRRKGIDVLIDAWRKIITRIPGLKLVIVGPLSRKENCNADEEYVQELQHEISTNRLEDTITLTGFVENAADYIKASDIYIFPSRREGLPNSLLEAMSCGLCCIASDLPCVRDIITDGRDGSIFPSGAVEQLAVRMMELARQSDIRETIGQNARQTIEKRFSLDTIADRYVHLYNHLLNHH